jgi:hypothetical protein
VTSPYVNILFEPGNPVRTVRSFVQYLTAVHTTAAIVEGRGA